MGSWMVNFLSVAAGGAVGAMMRFAVVTLGARLFGALFPWETLLVNILGSFALGFLAADFAVRESTPEWLRLFAMVGVAGGFTTFSTFSLDAVMLWKREAYLASGGYVLVSVILSITALLIGMWLATRAST